MLDIAAEHSFGKVGMLLRRLFVIAALIGAGLNSHAARANDVDDLYKATTIVTGQGEANRKVGFRTCLDLVLVKVSGDPRLPGKQQMAALRDDAGRLVAEYRYRDRMEGIPVHDEQGTHDRPHDLTCIYKPAVIDGVLDTLGSRPWLAERPRLAVFLSVTQGKRHFALDADGERGDLMRQSFVNAAASLAMRTSFPASSLLSAQELDDISLPATEMTVLDRLALQAGADKALAGSIVWSDKELGWIADWRLATNGATYRWQVRGVNFDEAFRVAIRGAAQILSGNGQP